MEGYMKRTGYAPLGLTALLSFMMLFSCSTEDFLGFNTTGNLSDGSICFGIGSDDDVQTKSGKSGNCKDKYTSGSFVLRSADSGDTLCVRAVTTDGISSSSFVNGQAITRGTPVDMSNFYDAFHVLAYWTKDGSLQEQFYMNDDVTAKGNNTWSSERTYYWPGAGHSLKFYAWAPANAFTSPSSPSSTILEYTVPEKTADQQDIVVASPDETPGDHNAAQSLVFNHVCTAVRFQTGSQIQPGTFVSVALKGVRGSGSFDLATSLWTLDGNTTSDFPQEINRTFTGDESEGSEITPAEGTFMMLPQTLPDGATVEVVFRDDNSGSQRRLEASIAGSEWPMGKTVTYKISVTPDYELEFVSEPEFQDAHYVIYPIYIKAGEIPGGWTMTSTDPAVTLRTDHTVLTRRGFWIEEDRGTQTISSTTSGEDITVYAFLEENVSEATREITLELRPTDMPNAKPATFTVSQLCPSWNGDLGSERIEDGDYPWGFLWPKGMKITYNMQNAGLGDLIRNALLNAYLSWFTDYSQFITKETWLLSITSVTINYDAVPQVAVAKDENNGLKNTLELYNFNGINDVSTLESILQDWGGEPEQELPLNPEEFAARSCSMKNKYHKTTEQQGGQTIEIPILPQDEIEWFLPAKNEALQMKDETYPLSGDYWTSTNSLDEHDNENAYKYTAGGSTALERRDVSLHVRAVRKKP